MWDAKYPSVMYMTATILKYSIKFVLQIWALLSNGLLVYGHYSSFLILLNDYMVHKIGSSKEEAALGVTMIGKKCLAIITVTI